MGGKSKAPDVPDYVGLAKQQAADSQSLANNQTIANRPNINTPTGSTTWTRTPGKSLSYSDYFAANPDVAATFNAGGTGMTSQDYALYHFNNYGRAEGRKINAAGDLGTDFDSTGHSPTQWTENQNLSPQQQALFDKAQTNAGTQLDTQGKSAAIANSLTGQVGADLAGRSNFASMLPAFSKIAGPMYDSTSRDRAEKALYDRQTQYLDPQFAQAEDAQRARLVASGLSTDSDAFKTSMDNFARTKQKAYSDARDSSIAAGGQEASNELNRGLAAAGFQQSEGAREQSTALQDIGVASADRQQSLKDFLALLGGGGMMTSSAGSGYVPPTLPSAALGGASAGTGADLSGAASQSYQGLLGNVNAANAQSAQNTQAGVSALGAIATIAAAY